MRRASNFRYNHLLTAVLFHTVPWEIPLNVCSAMFPMATALDQRGFGHYFRTHFMDKTFQGLYQVNAFDLALLIPYFIVLILLATYGIHRYVLVFLYYKNRKK